MDGSGDIIRLDFGTPISAVAPGWVGVGPSRYTPERGYGWSGGAIPFATDFGNVIHDPLTADFHFGANNSFRVDIPNGQYEVTAIAGARPYLPYPMSVWAEGTLAASGREDRLTFKVDVTDGQLDLRFAGTESSIYLLSGLQVTRMQAPLSVSAGDGYNAVEGSPVTLKATTSGGTGSLTYSWDLDGNGTFEATGQEVVRAFPDNGNYPVVVRVTDAGGQAALAMTMVSVANAAPKALIEAPGTAVAGAAVSFRGTGTDPGPADQAAGLRYAWDFGDGGTSDAASPSHAYAAPGTYTAQLTVTDKDGASASASTTTKITSTGLTASAGGPYQGTEGSPVTLRGTTSEGAVQPLAFAWDFDGDGTYESTGTEISHAFRDNGEYTVGMRVTDGSGQQAISSTKVTIANAAPVASAGGPYTGMPGMAVSFRGTGTDPGPADQAAGLRYAWDFGDGGTSDAASPSHAYAAPGTYTAQLTVTDKDGASASASATVSMGNHDSGGGNHGNPLKTHHDAIPDFGANATIVSAGSGPWSDPNTWAEHRVPAAGDVVSIRDGHTVTYDLVSDAALKAVSIYAGATLNFRTDIDTKLLVGTLLVRPDGALIVGTEANPVRPDVTARIAIADLPLDTTFDPSQYGTGLIGMGKVTMHGALMSSTFMRLAAEPKAGQTTLTLEQPVSGWKPGDQLILPDTRHFNESERFGKTTPQWEAVTIQSFSADGKTLTLTKPLQFDHIGARDGNGVLDFLPHVADLSRNVVIESQNPNGVRGHVMLTQRADVDIRYVRFANLGRTTTADLDNATFDMDGKPTHIGTNQVGRYSLHMHHLIGPAATPANGYQYTLIGNSIDGGDQQHDRKWGLAVHDSHYGLIRGNVVYNWAGAGITVEDGNETGNIFERNFVVATRGNRNPRENDGRDGAAFWVIGFNNSFRDNVAASAINSVQQIVSGVGFKFFWHAASKQNTRIPLYQGADPHVDGQYQLVDMQLTPIPEFARNEAYGAMAGGLTIWHLGTDGYQVRDIGETVIKDFRAWHVYEEGFFGYPIQNVTFDGFVVRGHPRAHHPHNAGYGWASGDYWAGNVTIRRADIQGMYYGVAGSINTPGVFRIEDSYFRNYDSNISIQTLATPGSGASKPPRRTEINNTRFVAWAGAPEMKAIVMFYYEGYGNADLIQTDEVFVTNYNGVVGDNFQVYYQEQRPDFITPQTRPGLVGSPEAGLTNQQNWDRYRIAVAGAVAPTTATTRPGIRGLVRSL